MNPDVGLISVLGAVDAIRAAQIASARTFNFAPYVVAALLFVLLAVARAATSFTPCADPPHRARHGLR